MFSDISVTLQVKSLTTIASRKLHTLTCVVLDTQKKTVE